MALCGFLRQSTADDVLIGPFVDSTDGATPMTSLTIDVEVSKNGQALAEKSDATAPTHDGGQEVDGYYNCELDATDTATCGILTLVCFGTGALSVRHDYMVLEEAIYDAIFAASANAFSGAAGSTTLTALAAGSITATVVADGAIDAGAIAADAITAAKIADGAIDAATFAAGAITATVIANGAIDAATFAAGAIDAAALAADASAEIADAVWDEDATGHQTGGTFGQAIGDPGASTETLFKAIITDPAGTNIAADIIAIKAETAAILVDTGTTLDGKIDSILADTGTDGVVVAAASKTGYALSTAGLAAFFTSDSGETYADAIAGSVVAEIADNAGGSSLTEAGIAAEVWATATRTLTAIDEDATTLDLDATIRAAVGLAANNLDTQLGDLPTNAELATALGTADDAVLTAIGDLPTNAELATALGTADDAVLAAIAALNDFDPATDEVLANVQKINDVAIVGDGSGAPFSVA